MILKYLRSSINLYPTQKLLFSNYTHRQTRNVGRGHQFITSAKFCNSLSQLKSLYQSQKDKMTVRNYSELCRSISQKTYKLRNYNRFQEKQFVNQIVNQILKIEPKQIAIMNLQSFIHFFRILNQRNYGNILMYSFLNKALNSEHMIQEMDKIQLKKLCFILYEASCLGSQQLSNIMNIITRRLDKLNEELKNSTENVNYQDISTILIKISNALPEANINRSKFRPLLKSAAMTLQLAWSKLQKNDLVWILYSFYNPSIRDEISFSNSAIVKQIQKSVFENIHQLDTRTAYQILENQAVFHSHLQSQIHLKIMNNLMSSIDQDGHCQIDIETIFRCLKALSRKDIFIPQNYCPAFSKFLQKSTTENTFKMIDSTLSQLIQTNLLSHECFQKMAYNLVTSKKQVRWSMRLLRHLNSKNFDITELLLANIETASKRKDFNYLNAAILVKQIRQKTSEISKWQKQFENEFENLSEDQFKNIIKIRVVDVMSAFSSYYGKKIKQRIQENFLNDQQQLTKQLYQFVCLFFPKNEQNKILDKLSSQKRIKLLNTWASNILDNSMNQEIIPLFLQRVLVDLDIKVEGFANKGILKILTSKKMKKFIAPSQNQIVDLYTKVVSKIFQIESEKGWESQNCLNFLESNQLFYYTKTSFYYKLIQTAPKSHPNKAIANNIEKSLINLNLIKKAELKESSSTIQPPLDSKGKIQYFLQLSQGLSTEQIDFVTATIKSERTSGLVSWLTKFNLKKTEESQKLLQRIVEEFSQKKFIQIENFNLMALIENLKKLVKQGYQKQLLTKVLKKLVAQLTPQFQYKIFLQDRLYLLSQATNLEIQLGLQPQTIKKLSENIQNNKCSTQLLARAEQIFKKNKWEMSNQFKSVLQQNKNKK